MRNLLFLSLFLALSASAQGQATGTPPFGSFSGGPDIINNANLNTHLTIPIRHKPGRGTPFAYDLTYDSLIWAPMTSGGSTTWKPTSSTWGWIGLQPAGISYISYSVTLVTTGHSGQMGQSTYTEWNYNNFAFYDSKGVWHYFPSIGGQYYSSPGGGSCPPNGPQPPPPYNAESQTASDGSGYTMYATINSSPSAYMMDSHGSVLNVPMLSAAPGSLTSTTDRNGNTISQSNGVYTDTLGTTALAVTGGAPNPTFFNYTAPSGASASYKVVYSSMTVQTNFGCSSIGEYAAASANLITEIDLPDISVNPNDKYTFTYEPTPGVSGKVTGRIASVTLPTGGTITYSYSGGNNGINCSDGSTATLTRTTPDGQWTYAQVKGTGAASTTTITAPQLPYDSAANQTVIQFQGIYETQRQIYQGSSSGTLLKTTGICYNANTINCTTTAVSSPITQRNITTILPGAANLQSQSIYKYNSNGSLIEQDDYAYGSGAPGSLLKKTAISYASLGSITSSRQQVIVTDGSGATVSKINYNYDETAVVATSGTPQHTGVSGSRGNLTSINYYANATAFLTKRMTYFDTGVVQTSTDANGAAITSVFSNSTATCGNAFPTSVSEPLSLSKSMVWNCTGSTQTSVTDENTQVSSTSFTDPYFWRPASVTDPTSAVANFTYASRTQSESALNFNGTSSTNDALVTRDSLGRPHLAQKKQTPSSTNYDTVETDYDKLGRPSRATLPYVAGAGVTNSTAPSVTTTYDALSRTISLADSGSGTRAFSYSQNDVYITRGPTPAGENAKRRQEEFDALGRLVSVCEITAGTTSDPAGTCAQNSSQTGYWTKYAYDALGRLTGVTQNAQSSNPQSRTYVYDLMGRLTSETNPENGTTTYTYDTEATCGTSNGDLVKKTDAVGNVTCTTYDSLHRPVQIYYPSGLYSSSTPTKKFVYDSAIVNGVTMTNAKGRLAEAYTCTGSCTSKITDEGFSYTVRGETSDVYMSTPHSGGYYHVSAQYWANGALKQIASLVGLPTISFAPDGEGRVYQVSSSSGQNPVTNTVFNAASLVTSVTYGSGDSDSFAYDPNTFRLTQYQFSVNTQSLTGVLTWNANHTLASQNITDPFNSADTQNCSYTHDDLTRLASVNCGTPWSQTFSYDAFGNLSKSGTQSFQPVYKDAGGNTSNRYVSIPGTTVSYDANGNVLSDGSHTYSMDSAGRPVSVDTVNLTYDAFGRMVEQNRSGSYTQIVYGPKSLKLALMNAQTLQKGLVPLPGGGQAVYNSSGLLYYGHSDHLGSAKLGSTPSRTMYFDMAYAPFGEIYATSGTTDASFTGQRQDTVAGLFDFPDREYSTQGRWPHPDPSGLASVNLSDPQSLNRYAYVRNNPLANVDPNGLVCNSLTDGAAGGDPLADGTGIFTQEDCEANGGTWTDPGGSGDPTSGGDPQNSGSNCPTDDPLCGQVPGGMPPGDIPPTLGTVPTAPIPSGLVVVDYATISDPTSQYGGLVSLTLQLVDQNGNAMPLEGLNINATDTVNGPMMDGFADYTTNSAGQIVTNPFVGNFNQEFYTSDQFGTLNENPIEIIRWEFNTTGLYAPEPNAPSVPLNVTFNVTGINSSGIQNINNRGTIP